MDSFGVSCFKNLFNSYLKNINGLIFLKKKNSKKVTTQSNTFISSVESSFIADFGEITSEMNMEERKRSALAKREVTIEQALSVLISLGLVPPTSTALDVFGDGKLYTSMISNSFQSVIESPTSSVASAVLVETCGPSIIVNPFDFYFDVPCVARLIGEDIDFYYEPFIPPGATPQPTPEPTSEETQPPSPGQTKNC